MNPDQKHNPEFEPNTSGFGISVVSDPEQLLELEVSRVMFYLSRYADYTERGYQQILRFPDGIDPTNPPRENRVRQIVSIELDRDHKMYENFADTFAVAIEQISSIGVPVAEQLYGFKLHGNIEVAPSAYGTVGSTSPIISLRLPQFYPDQLGVRFTTGSYRTPIEILMHEAVTHKGTARLREDTCINESIYSHQWYKERLMDLLGRSILVQSGLLLPEQVAMRTRAEQEASGHIDPLYYTDSTMPSESNLPWTGDLSSLVKQIDNHLTKVLGNPPRDNNS